MKKNAGSGGFRGMKSPRMMIFPKTALMLLMCLLVLDTMAFSQHKKFDISFREVPIAEVLQYLRQVSDYNFLYDSDALKRLGLVTVEKNNVDLEEVLKHCFKGSPFIYLIEDELVIIREESTKQLQQTEKSKKLVGTVTDVDGNPLPGVTVQIRKTTWGTVTDAAGKYQLEIPDVKNLVLVFSFVGMQKLEITYKGESAVNVTMQEDITQIDEVVVTGYQVVDKRYSTSAISSVRAEDILVAGMNSIDAALEGRIPELLLMSNSGEVGATPKIRIRGTSTLLGNREPLWVLDGIVLTDPVRVDPTELNNPDYINVIGNAIAGINPQDIERIDVLKDASATALYGTRAANGVIVVTTKKGRSGKARVSYNHSSKLTLRPRYSDRDINLMNSRERVWFGKELTDIHYVFPEGMVMVGYEGAAWRFQTGQTNYRQFMDEIKYYEEVNTDWFRELTQDAYSQGHNLSISGGNEDVRYYSSVGYDREEGVSKSTYTERYTAMVNLNTQLFQKLRVGFQLNGNVQKKNHQMEAINAMDYAYNTTRALPCYNEDGSLFFYENRYFSHAQSPDKKFLFNIVNEIENSSNMYDGHGVNARLDLRYDIMKGWNVNVIGAFNRSSTLQEKWWGEKTQYVAMFRNAEYTEKPTVKDDYCELPYGGILMTAQTVSQGYTLRAQSDFSRAVGKDMEHLLAVAVGFEVSSSKYRSDSEENRGFVKERGLQFVEDISLEDFPGYARWLKNNHPVISENLTNMLAGYATFSYSYQNHFTLNVNARFDASNKFGSRSNEKFLPVWSLSGMWNGKENLLKDVHFISNLQLRASLGLQGNMLDDQSPNLIIRQGVIDPFYGENTSSVARFPNPNLSWEQTKSLNLTLDIDMLDSRLAMSGTYYLKKTKDCFTDMEVSPLNGLNTYTMNNGNLRNSGYSLSVSGLPVRTKDFTWRFSAFWSGNYNKVEAEIADEYSVASYLDGKALVDGKSVSTFYSYKFLGLNPQNGVPVFDDYEERRHLLEGKSLDETVQMVLKESGQREPKFFGNLSTSLNYKGWALSASFTYSLGSKVRLFSLYSPVLSGIKADANVRKEFVNRWLVPGDEKITNIPVIMSPADPDYKNYSDHYSTEPGVNVTKFASNIWDMYDKSDIRVVSGNYLKCTSLTLRYSFNDKLLHKTPFSSAYISFNTMNLFTISARELKGQDPTQAGFDKPNLSVRPAYSLGLNVSF